MSVAVWRSAFGESRFQIKQGLVLDEPNATHHSDIISFGDRRCRTALIRRSRLMLQDQANRSWLTRPRR